MKNPEEIKKALELCVRDEDDCVMCPYFRGEKCYEVKRDALTYIRQLETRIAELEAKPSKPAPAPAQDGLPKGWVRVLGDYGEALVIDASKVVSVEDCYPVDRRIVRFSGTHIYSSESVKEIIAKIKEAVDDGELEQT